MTKTVWLLINNINIKKNCTEELVPQDYVCFSLQHRISQLICSVQPVRVPQFPKLCSFLRTTSSTHFTKVTYFSRWWYFFCTISQFFYCIIRGLSKPFLIAAIFSPSRKLSSKFLILQNFWHHFTWYHWLRNVPVVSQPIVIHNFDV